MEKILVAFSHFDKLEGIIKRIIEEFKNKGISVQISQEFFLPEIEKSINVNSDYRILILQEHLEKNKFIKVPYLEKLITINPKLNIIYIIDNHHYKSSYIGDIYKANIYNCLFKRDANIENIVYLCLNPRTEIEAKSYYGLMDDFNGVLENDYSDTLDKSMAFTTKNMRGNNEKERVIIKERIVYTHPKDYQKIIGIFSPYAAGKTVIASNLAKCYVRKNLTVTLIDTDYLKKDLLYYYPLEDGDFFKVADLYNDLNMGKEIGDVNSYAIEIGSKLKLFTDHRDSRYEMNLELISHIVRDSKSNIVIIDISSTLGEEVVNEVLSICDERLLVADKMISTLNGLPYRLSLKTYNRRNLSLIINRDVDIRGLPNRKLEKYFKDVELPEKERFSLNFEHIFFIPNRLELIAEALSSRDVAYGEDQEFDESIEVIASSLYQINNNYKGGRVRSILDKLFTKGI